MPQYRFISSAPAAIYDTPYAFTRYGQLVEMPEDLWQEKKDRLPLIPAADFDALGHTPDEIKKYGRPAREGQSFPGHDNLDAGFEAKRNKAWEKWHELRAPKPEVTEETNATV